MNGWGIPAGMGPGGGYSGYNPLAVPATYGTPEGNIAKSWLGPEPVPLAGDISALTSPEPVWFDVNAPLQFQTPAPVVTAEPMPVLSTLYTEPTGNLIPETVFPAESLGPIEWIINTGGNIVQVAGDVVKTGVDVAWDVAKTIAENLQVGVKVAGDIGGAAAKYKTAEAQLKAAEAAKIQAQAQLTAAQRPVTPTVTDNLADWLSRLTGVPSAATPPFVEAGTAMGGIGVEAPTNWMLLGALAIGAYLLLKR